MQTFLGDMESLEDDKKITAVTSGQQVRRQGYGEGKKMNRKVKWGRKVKAQRRGE